MKRSAFPAVTILLVVLALSVFTLSCGSGGGSSPGPVPDPDAAAPTVPPSFAATTISTSQISVAWGASSDNIQVAGYKVYRAGTFLRATSTLSVLDTGLTSSTQYCYQVSAYDQAGNESAKCTQACAITSSVTATIPPAGASFKMPDTNQTLSYTPTFGEDHDYLISVPSYTDNGNGTITDNVTGLIWQKQDDNTAKTWDDAKTYCSNLSLGGQTGWRLPTRIELISLVDYGAYQPAVNATYFPNVSLYYWSSTTLALYTVQAWFVDFYDGSTFYITKTAAYASARCVHD